YFVFALPALILVLYAQLKVKSTYKRYLEVPNARGVSGLEAGRALLDSAGLWNVSIEGTPGELTDNYDPRTNTLRLSAPVARGRSVAALGIVAHEVGHAQQDARGYPPLRVRSRLVPVVNLGTNLGYLFFILGMLLRPLAGLIWVGIALFSLGVIFMLVTLPVEWNASGRALAMLKTSGMVGEEELRGARRVLSAAALTYVAALAQTISTLLYYLFIAVGMRRRDD
ncbi:MAG: zinc metallopeptidase, partial [Chloroflexota bacterium]|nr:zinc metallopeptidase [Chloroflexota bacterium]